MLHMKMDILVTKKLQFLNPKHGNITKKCKTWLTHFPQSTGVVYGGKIFKNV